MSTKTPSWLRKLESCDSTNTWALGHLDELAHGDCVWTQKQTAGRGQAGRSWISDPGILTASFIITPRQHTDVTLLSLCAGLAVAHCIEDHLPQIQVDIKWPNDCFIAGRKIAGTLCEGKMHAGTSYMIIGIGLNVNPLWASSAQDAAASSFFNGRPPISMAELGPAPALPTVIAQLRQYIRESIAMIEDGRWSSIVPDLQKRDCLRGQHVEITQKDGITLGIAEGINEDGALLIRLPDGGCMICTSSHNLRILDVLS